MMLEKIGKAAMLEQAAEECTELAKALLKRARIERKENPTPVTEEAADKDIREEATDVIQCLRELGVQLDEGQIRMKEQRFQDRWEDNKNDRQGFFK